MNYFQGATINNLVINGNMNKKGTEYYQHENGSRTGQEKWAEAEEPTVQDEVLTNKSHRGRPGGKESLRSLFADEALADERLQLMDCLIRGQKGKRAALVVTCAAEAGWLTDLPSYEQVCDAFGNIGSRSNYYERLQKHFTNGEKQLIYQKMGVSEG